jgi:hypothetical protein
MLRIGTVAQMYSFCAERKKEAVSKVDKAYHKGHKVFSRTCPTVGREHKDL